MNTKELYKDLVNNLRSVTTTAEAIVIAVEEQRRNFALIMIGNNDTPNECQWCLFRPIEDQRQDLVTILMGFDSMLFYDEYQWCVLRSNWALLRSIYNLQEDVTYCHLPKSLESICTTTDFVKYLLREI